MTEIAVGIDDLSFATSHFVLAHAELAEQYGVDLAKYHVGIGQEAMSILAPDEDIVTLAAAAAAPVVAEADEIRTVLLATESSVDQSKAGAVHVAELLGLPTAIRCIELKQA